MTPDESSIINDNEDASSTGIANDNIEDVQPEINHHEWTSNDDLVEIKLDYGVDELTENSTDLETGTDASDDLIDAKAEESDEAENDEKPKTLAMALLDALRANGEPNLDPRLGRRARDFQFAQSERARKTKSDSWFTSFDLFNHLACVRADIQWAEDAAWRRENNEPYVSWEDYEQKRKQKNWKHPYLVYLILICHFFAMMYQFHLGGWTVEPFKENVLIGPPGSRLEAGGMNAKEMIVKGSWWRLVSATSLHGGILHYLANDLVIYFLGRMIEINHGVAAFFLVYFLSSITGNVLSALFNPGPTSVGASGAVFGLIGACMADVVVNWNLMFLVFRDRPAMSKCCTQMRCLFIMLFEMAFNWFIGLTIYIDNFAHMGGWIYGFLAGVVVLERLPLGFFGKGQGLGTKCRGFFFRFLVATVVAGSIAYFSVELSQSDGETIPYPEISPYVGCAEFPFWTEEKWWYCDSCATKEIPATLWKSDNSTFYRKVEFECPDGSMVVEDFTEFGFEVAAQVKAVLPGLCRNLC
ncbi:MAG: hypothetical protein SGBAC_007421 [Bacillariaceae sp.]